VPADAGHGRPGAAAGEDPVIASARSGEPDRYLAALLAPPAARADLLALAAFASELARVPSLVTREPTMGEIRLQWWRDALAAPSLEARTGNPVADAVRAAMHRNDLPAPLLLDMIDAREVDLALYELPDDAAFATYLWKSDGAPFALAAGILHPDSGVDLQAAAAAAGQAYGLARLLLGLPHALARGRVPLPQSRLDACAVSNQELLSGEGGNVAALTASLCAEARKALATSREQVANLPRQVRPAFLPLALVEPYLRALERPGRDVLRSVAEIAPLTRVWRIAAAHWLGRI
jgi:phytoene synthase